MRETYQDLENQEIGKKYDDDKPKYHLIPEDALEGMAKIFTFGANKYGEGNWAHVKPNNRYYSAAMRHLIADKRGETLDPESGLRHLDHAITSLIMLRELKRKEE
jgi:hypothetical protein